VIYNNIESAPSGLQTGLKPQPKTPSTPKTQTEHFNPDPKKNFSQLRLIVDQKKKKEKEKKTLTSTT
jgi:hypothetical protein